MASGWRVRGYVLEQQLGRGGSSEVWRARIAATGEQVALKRLLVPGAEQLNRAHAEAAKLSVLDHPHLVRLHALVPDGAAAVLVLDLADGGSLADLIAVRGRLTEGEVITALAPVAAALAYLHGAGVVHGDVSAANVLFSARGTALLADLGVARLTGDESGTESTPAYIDPIVARGEFPSPSSDVFMLGAVALHALVGEPLWSGGSVDEVLDRAREGDLAAVGARLAGAGVDETMAAVVRRALHPDPLHRGSAADLALDLRHSGTPVAVELAAGRTRPEPPPGVPVPPSPAETSPRRGGRHAAVPAAAPAGRTPAGRVPAGGTSDGVVPADVVPDGSAPDRAASTRLPWRRSGGDEDPAPVRSVSVRSVPVGAGSVPVDAADASRPAFARPGEAVPAIGPASHMSRARSSRPGAPAPTASVRSPPRPAIPVPGRRPRRRLVGVAGVVVALLAAAVAFLVTGTASGGRPTAHRPEVSDAAHATVRTPTAPSTGSSRARAAPAADVWTARLAQLDGVRARAYATRDVTLLRSVYASPVLLAADTAQLRRIVPAGCGLSRATTGFTDVRTARSGSSTVVTAAATLAPARLLCHGASRGVTAAVPTTRLRIVLVHITSGTGTGGIGTGGIGTGGIGTGDTGGWRIAAQTRAP